MAGGGHIRAYQTLLSSLLVGVVCGSPLLAQEGQDRCDWQRGEPYKMHWPQLPDLGFTGMDVGASAAALADDFKCTETGPIRLICLWGSFLDDAPPGGQPDSLSFELSIYSDIPASENRWSRPGELLWTRAFKPGEYTVRKIHDGPEDWYDPVVNMYLAANHRQAFQYCFCVNDEPFVQQEGTIYWLGVRALSDDPDRALGWKTTTPQFRWNDDAVYLGSANADWRELKYPERHAFKGESLDLAFVIASGGESRPTYDLGDAPDSSNSYAGTTMLAYPSGVLAHFPTVYHAGSPPYGPLHLNPRDMFFLGKAVSEETEADMGLDEDAVNNLDPPNDAANRDGADDGLHLPVLMPPCRATTLDYTVTVTSPAPRLAFVNVWCDWNRDGDWDDRLLCPDGTPVSEWAVQNHIPALPGAGTYAFTTPLFVCWHPDGREQEPLWLRITISEQPQFPTFVLPGAGPGLVGTGPSEGYQYGETEDYYIRPQMEPTPVKYDWGDAPDVVGAPGYPTLAVNDGARHVPVGPWLGDENNAPDSEPDGQPHPDALGDNLGGVKDDETGVSIPPLIEGHSAAATVQVGGGGGVVQGWIDFDGDRTWEPGEQVCDGFLPDGIHVISFTVPAGTPPGQTFARFRISTRGGLNPGGEATDGEVEDLEVWIDKPPEVEKQWCQLPDLTPYGIDIRVDNSDGRPRMLADDFECTRVGRLTHIRLWGSWKDDRRGEIKKIVLRIHPDDPVGIEGADQRNQFSMPGPEVLWTREFLPGQFEELLHHVLPIGSEWWWDPTSGEATPRGDKQVWQIDMKVDPDEAFLQEGTPERPQIYWLAVEVETAEGLFGWKTRRWPEHFMDDAVWDESPELPRVWNELRYPPGHRFFEHERNSIDLAFCLMFTPDTTPLPTAQPTSVTQCPALQTTCPAVLTRCPPIETRCPIAETKCPPLQTQCPPTLTRCPLTPTQCESVLTQCPAVETRCPPVQTKCPPAVTQCPPALTKCPLTATQCATVLTQCPPVETRCPPVETKCPPVITQCPPALTKCPLTPTQCTSVLTQCPAVETRCPPVETKCPPVQTQCPVVSTECPAEPTRCPPALTKCPLTPTQCTSVLTQCPAVLTRCPVEPTRCPPVLTQCPQTATQCTSILTQCPVTETRCPPSDTKCPPVQTQCPVVSTECPTAPTRCPPALTKCPLTPTQCTSVQTQCPAVATECPAEPTRCPPVLTQCPPTATLCTSVLTQCPTTPTRCPPVETKCPSVQTQCPVVSTECPSEPTRCPPALTKCPLTPTQCTSVLTQCPVTETRCPPVATKCPSLQTQCPAVQTQCPVALTECPAESTRCPPALTKCPQSVTLCLGVITQCPPEETKCPPVQTQCPGIATECPTAVTRCPPALTKCPMTPTQCMSILTQCPAIETRCPPADTKCPVVQTTCPTLLTSCPPSDTLCPPVSTRCPISPTRCPALLTLCTSCLPFDASSGAGLPVAARCPTVETPCMTVGDYLLVARDVR